MATTDFYNENATQLIERYDNADMSSLHKLLLKYTPYKSSVFDIGFGSGRDLQFLNDNSYDIWGIDPSIKFVQNAKNRFPTKKEQFFEIGVPFDKKEIGLNKKFDTVITIAMWMHIKHDKYADVVESILSVAKSTVI
ncbi:MAG: methyltransferase domain-containing protein, partial [Campylobacterota bacterium]|nr:methyltransferase domain-containing protein [Campylobacterota bacterium]